MMMVMMMMMVNHDGKYSMPPYRTTVKAQRDTLLIECYEYALLYITEPKKITMPSVSVLALCVGPYDRNVVSQALLQEHVPCHTIASRRS